MVSWFSLAFGLFLGVLTYRVVWGTNPECSSGFKGLGGSLQCGAGNPSFAPYAWTGIGLAALMGIRWWRRFVRSLDA